MSFMCEHLETHSRLTILFWFEAHAVERWSCLYSRVVLDKFSSVSYLNEHTHK